jgi:hypothetical protein
LIDWLFLWTINYSCLGALRNRTNLCTNPISN